MSKISRRDFLKFSGVVIGGSVVACGGLSAIAMQKPTIEMPEYSFGDVTMSSQKILIAYASKAGSTVEIAKIIGETIASKGMQVDVKPVNEANSIQAYNAVILGSAIRMGQWLPDILTFAENNKAELAKIPAAIFSVHLQNLGDTPAEKENRMMYTKPIKDIVQVDAEVFFSGKMDMSRLSIFEKVLCKMLKSVNEDLRDWNVIRSWANEIPAVLKMM